MKRFLPFLLIFALIIGGCVQPPPDLATFLEVDKTNEIPYTDDFKCLEFAERLCFNAQEEGLKAGIIFVFFENGGNNYHALNVFDIDNDLVFVDCSTGKDAIVNVEIGKPYSTSYSEITNERYFITLSATSSIWGGRIISDYMIVWDMEKFIY